jgi:flagellar hook-length control protein FliK
MLRQFGVRTAGSGVPASGITTEQQPSEPRAGSDGVPQGESSQQPASPQAAATVQQRAPWPELALSRREDGDATVVRPGAGKDAPLTVNAASNGKDAGPTKRAQAVSGQQMQAVAVGPLQQMQPAPSSTLSPEGIDLAMPAAASLTATASQGSKFAITADTVTKPSERRPSVSVERPNALGMANALEMGIADVSSDRTGGADAMAATTPATATLTMSPPNTAAAPTPDTAADTASTVPAIDRGTRSAFDPTDFAAPLAVSDPSSGGGSTIPSADADKLAGWTAARDSNPAAAGAVTAHPEQAAALLASAGSAPVVAPTPTESAAQVSGPTTSPTQQISAALVSVGRTADGGQHITLRLQPPELGQVEIRIDRPTDAPARVDIAVQRPETMTLLLRDQPELQRALDQAGVPADGRSITIHIAVTDAATSAASAAGSTGSAGLGQQANDSGTNRQSTQGRPGGAPDQAPDDRPAPLVRWLRAGLDITA